VQNGVGTRLHIKQGVGTRFHIKQGVGTPFPRVPTPLHHCWPAKQENFLQYFFFEKARDKTSSHFFETTWPCRSQSEKSDF